MRSRAAHSGPFAAHVSVLVVFLLQSAVPQCTTQPTAPPSSLPKPQARRIGPQRSFAECGPAVAGFTFLSWKDHKGDDIGCARAEVWSIAGQAAECDRLGDVCAGFNVDSFGSCIKSVATPLEDMTGDIPIACFGTYVKTNVTECTPEEPGFIFIGGVDHVGDDLDCVRDVAWTIPERADACRADGVCQGFNVDGYGSCWKSVASPLGEMWSAWAVNPCYGFYAKPTAHPPECGAMPAGFAFLVGLDHSGDDIKCIRKQDPSTWNVTSQAAACRADPTCTSFNADVMGSCLKSAVLPLTQQWQGVACYGMYVKTSVAVPALPPARAETTPSPLLQPTCQRWDDYWFVSGYKRGVGKVFSGVAPGGLASAAAACSTRDQCDGFDTETVLAYNFSLAPRMSALAPCEGVYIKATRLFLFPELGMPSQPSAPPPTHPTPPSPPRLPLSSPTVVTPPPPSSPTPASPTPPPSPSGGTGAGGIGGGNSTGSEKDSASGFPGWAIGVVAGVVVGLLALCVAITVVLRRQRIGRVKSLPPSSLEEESASSTSAPEAFTDSQGTRVQIRLTASPSWKERQSDGAKAASLLGAGSQPYSTSSSDSLLQGALSAELPAGLSPALAKEATDGGGKPTPPPPLPCLAALRLAPLVAPPVALRSNDKMRAKAKVSKLTEAPTLYSSQDDSFDMPEGSSLLIDRLHHEAAAGALHEDLHPELMKAEIQRQNIKLKDEQLELYEQLGRGGSGTVYRALWKGLPVAAKLMILHADSRDKAYRQMMEATMSTGLSHANIVNTYACDLKCLGEAEAQQQAMQQRKPGPLAKTWQMTILQELCLGGSLKVLISSGALSLHVGSPEQLQMKLAHVLQLSLDIASGLEHLHSKNIVHSDLTPANVLLQVAPAGSSSRPPGLQWLAKVADFGLSIVFEDGHSHVSRVFAGTPHYIAPETQAHGNISKQSDIFTLGVLMYEMVCGMASSGHLSAVTPGTSAGRSGRPSASSGQPSSPSAVKPLGGSVGSHSRPSLSVSRSRSTIHSSDMTVSVSLFLPPQLPQTPVSKDATAGDGNDGQTDERASPPAPPPLPQQQGGGASAAASGTFTTPSNSDSVLSPLTVSRGAVSQEPLLFGGCRGRNGPPMALAPLPPAVPHEFRSLIVSCLSQTPQNRPTVAQVHQQLSKLLQAHAGAPPSPPPPNF